MPRLPLNRKCQVETETAPSVSPEIAKSAFQTRAIPFPGASLSPSFSVSSRLLSSSIASECYLDTQQFPQPQMLRNLSAQHWQLSIPGPSVQTLRERIWLAQPSPGWVPLLSGANSWRRRHVVHIGQPEESREKNLIKDVWQETRTGVSSDICYYLQHSKSMPLVLSI